MWIQMWYSELSNVNIVMRHVFANMNDSLNGDFKSYIGSVMFVINKTSHKPLFNPDLLLFVYRLSLPFVGF